MPSAIHPIAIVIFCACFALVTVAGFLAARWRAADLNSLEEWGLAGRKFGTLITWFLIGGDFYTAYTVIAVPAALYGVGAYGFFAIPYCILLYPYMMLVLPKLWAICHRNGYVTLADFVRGRYGSRALSIAIALTGILATMPYIALQLVGMREVIAALGVHGEWPLGCGVPHFGGIHLYERIAGTGGDRHCERRDVVHHGGGGGYFHSCEAGRLWAYIRNCRCGA